MERGQLSHAYLFVGPPHVGKMTLALSLAQAVNCPAKSVPCSECPSCRRIAAGKHADVQIIDLTSPEKGEISIDQIREMQLAANLPPYEGKCKVFIINRAELLSQEASNCLLKTLEEPLPQVLFILLTSRERLLLPTIVSRCQQVELPPLPITRTKEVLSQHYGIAEQKLELLARLSRGCLGWILLAIQDERLLEERSRKLTTLVNLGYASRKQRLIFATELATQFSKNREQLEEVLTLWLGWWRDLLLTKGGNDGFITNIDRKSSLLQQVQNYTMEQIKSFTHHLQIVTKQLEQNANPRLVLEVLMLNMP